MFFESAKAFLLSFMLSVLNYNFSDNGIHRFNGSFKTCDESILFPKVSFFSSTGFESNNIDCIILPNEQNQISSENKLEWKVSQNGFHTSLELAFEIKEFPERDCIYSLFIPPSSFLDVPEADDRELPAPQIPKIHYSPLNQTKVEIQHRYPIPDGETHKITIFPPDVFCINSKQQITKIKMSKPNSFSLEVPAASPKYANIVYIATAAAPIIALLVHVCIIFCNKYLTRSQKK